MSLPHTALAPSGQAVWLDAARRSARALVRLDQHGIVAADIVSEAALRNAMVVYAAFGGSTNLLLHIPAIAHAAGLSRPTIEDWDAINRKVPRLVDVLPNGPVGHPTVRVFLAGGVPEVMLHLRELGLLQTDVLTVSGEKLAGLLDWWEKSERRKRLRDLLYRQDGIDPDDVIMSPTKAQQRGLTSTITLPRGNLAPQGSVVKSTAIDPSLLGADGVYRMVGTARVFLTERAAIEAIKKGAARLLAPEGRARAAPRRVQPGQVIVLICAGPMGSGMEEILQVTGALKALSWGKDVAVITDGRFSGVSIGPCIGHVAPEALAGGPIGKVLDGDIIEIVIDCKSLHGSVNLVGDANCPREKRSVEFGTDLLAKRRPRPDLAPRPDLPADTHLWSALQDIGGGTWGGCVFDVGKIVQTLDAGRNALSRR
jgi:putative YjhG/YagF family dehydratase